MNLPCNRNWRETVRRLLWLAAGGPWLALAILLLLPPAAWTAAPEVAKDTEMKVRLTAPVSTATNQKGDKITAMVVEPEPFRGAVMEGEIRESKSGNKFKGKSTLQFAFQMLTLKDGTQVPVNGDVKSFTNSKGQQNTDEEGFLIEKKNNIGKMAVASGIGALIGGLAAGGKGAAIGAGVGAGAALILVQFGSQAPNIRLDPGSELVLNVNPRREAAK